MSDYPLYYHIGLPKTGTKTVQYVMGLDSRINLIRDRIFSGYGFWSRPLPGLAPGKVHVVSEENQITQVESASTLSLLLARIKRFVPDARIIVTLREQRDALESRYRFNIPYYGGDCSTFQTWLESRRGMEYASICMYSSVYDTIRAFFPGNQVHFLLFEDLKFDYDGFLKGFYGIMQLEPPAAALGHAVVKNRSLTDSELVVVRCLNRFKLFRKNTPAGRLAVRLFRSVASRFRQDGKKLDSFRWSNIRHRENIDAEFARQNAGLVSRGLFSADHLRKYKYLIDASAD